MGLVLVSGLALALLLLTLVTVAIVQLVLLFTVRNTLLALAVLGIYWFVDSRRRQVAKGFYSCQKLSPKETTQAQVTVEAPTQSTASTSDVKTEITSSGEVDSVKNALPQAHIQAIDAPALGVPMRRVSRKRSLSEHARPLSDRNEREETMRDSVMSLSDSESTSDQVEVAAVVPTSTGAPTQGAMRLPELRRKKWTAPSHSVALKPKGEELLRRSTISSASSPRRPELYGSPRSVAMEQKIIKNALESDGYWIGDFRHPQPTRPRRQTSTGASTPTKPTATATSPLYTSSRAV